jgi:hypothetical protein
MLRSIFATTVRSLLAVACLALFSDASQIAAQGVAQGALTGIVRDETGAVIPNAGVTATNQGTSVTVRAQTNDSGVYLLRPLPAGAYDVEVSAQGFKKKLLANAVVRVDEESRLDITLSPGQISEEVRVTADATPVNTNSATLKTVIDERRINDLPLNGRNPNSLILLVAGVAPDTRTSLTSGTTYPGVQPISSNGGRGNTTNYVLDGGSNNDIYSNAPNPTPNPDALQEFSVQTNNFSAEYGRNLGAVVTAVTKSGTNQYHGSLFEYLRNNAVNASNFFTPGRDDGLKRNQYGGTMGGPVRLPKSVFGPLAYEGRDRAFFFFSYQGTKSRRAPADSTALVPTAAQLAGDFSALRNANGTLRQLRHPVTGANFPNNQIPTNLFDPVAVKLLGFIPTAGGASNLIRFGVAQNTDDDQYLGRGDYNLSSSNRLFGRVWISQASTPALRDPQNFLAGNTGRVWRNTVVSLNDTHTFSSSVVNVLVLTFNRTNNRNHQVLVPSLASLGSKIYSDSTPQLSLNVGGYFNLNTGDTNIFTRDEYQIANTTRVTKGAHSFSFGGDYSRAKNDILNNFRANGNFSFNGQYTGDALADFLFGKFNNLIQGVGEYKFTRLNFLGLFAQDDWRINRRMTLNLGLRWDPFIPYTDVRDRLASFRPGEQSTFYTNAPRGLLFPGDPQLPEGGYDATWTNFGPRIGLAWDVFGDGKTSLRAGYGIFYDHPNTIMTNGAANQAPFGTTVAFPASNASSLSDPYAGRANPFPQSLTPPRDFVFPTSLAIYSYDPGFTSANLQSWNLTVEREVFNQALLRVAYAGSKGTRLGIIRELNPAVFAPGATVANTNQRRPLGPAFATMASLEATANSSYHSLQVTFDKRFSRGLSALVAYTWSKSIDLSSANKLDSGGSFTNPNNARFDRGLANFDRPHRFTASFLYQLPLRFQQRLAQSLLGGWTLTGIATIQSGPPFTVTSGVDTALTGTPGQRPDQLRDPRLPGDRPRAEQILRYFDTTAFGPAPAGTFGTVGRNTLRAPGYTSYDLGLQKNFALTEQLRLQFRFEAFNTFNHVNLGVPNSARNSALFGTINRADDPRILQFALRLNF